MNPGTTWWSKSKPFMDYLSRCSYLLRQGLFVADACYYYGDQTPNFFPFFHDVPEKPRIKGLSNGYDFDVINTDIILNRMSVKDGRLVLPDGMSYSILMLPDQVQMTMEVLEKIMNLVKAGATVVGPRPATVPGLKDWEKKNSTLNRLAAELWGTSDGQKIFEHTYGKGKIIWGIAPDQVLSKKSIEPDFSCTGTSPIDYIHRTTEMGEVYFLSNESEKTVNTIGKFRVKGKYPEIWDPSTGAISRVAAYTQAKLSTSFEIELPPHGSTFVVFNNTRRSKLAALTDLKKGAVETSIAGPWKVNFPANWGAPASVVFDQLISWTASENPGIKYFSGTAVYHNSFKLSDGAGKKTILLNLGDLRDVAEVFVNGKSAGILWKKPYQVDISQLVQPGTNDLKIELVNLWINRLTGDMLLDPKDRFCQTNQSYMTSEVWPGGDEPFRIQTAGLLGPVTLTEK
jgi:alpha-L-rhamnosidase